MLSGRFEISVSERYICCNFIRAPIESGRLSNLEPYKSSLYKLMRFQIERGRDITLLDNRSGTFKCVNFSMLSGMVEIFVSERYNYCNFIRALIKCGRLSSSEFDKSSISKLTRFPIKLARHFTLLHIRSSTFKCVNFSMLSRRVEIFVPKRFNSCNFIGAPIESGRFSSS